VMAAAALEGVAVPASGAPDARHPGDARAATDAVPEVLALLDARRGQWYAGAWRRGDGAGELPVATLAEGLYSPAGLAEDLPRAVIGMCPDAVEAREACERAGLRFTAWIEGPAARPRADWVGRVAALRLARGEGGPAADLRARYLRRAEAEAVRTGRAVEAGETERRGGQ
jgi:tRNA A37 threonylcarbamoyladenosine modification protein TsaB